MNPQTITDKIYSAADEELKKRLSAVFQAARREFQNGCNQEVSVYGAYIHGTPANSQQQFRVDAFKAIEELEKLSFKIQFEAFRQQKIAEFMDKVQKLDSELEEIRNSIPQ